MPRLSQKTFAVVCIFLILQFAQSAKNLTLDMLGVLPLKFPTFDIFSTPLLLFMLQGAVFTALLFVRGYKKRRIADILLGTVVLITCYERTHYAIGFMEWYDTFRNTKINYFLIDSTLFLAPMIYFYVLSVTKPAFKFGKRQLLHLIPFGLYTIYSVVLYLHDAAQPGFEATQNGQWMRELHFKYVDPLLFVVVNFGMLLYLAFALQQYYNYRQKITQFYSNTYRLQLNWIRNFLFIYTGLFAYQLIQSVVDSTIVDLHWKQEWWYHLLSAVIVVYVGIKGYFTDTLELSELRADQLQSKGTTAHNPLDSTNNKEQLKLLAFMEEGQPYLDPELTLSQLAIGLNMPRTALSDLLNKELGKNFNDFINSYRVQRFKMMVKEGRHKQLSVLGLAEEAGFNSKATFNRVFKKHANMSPTDYINTQ